MRSVQQALIGASFSSFSNKGNHSQWTVPFPYVGATRPDFPGQLTRYSESIWRNPGTARLLPKHVTCYSAPLGMRLWNTRSQQLNHGINDSAKRITA